MDNNKIHKICFFNRSSIHYRKNIYMLMDKELNCDFRFGDYRPGKIKPMDESLLTNNKSHLKNKKVVGPFYWQIGAFTLLKSDYTYLITPGETYCLSSWFILLLARLYRKKVYLWTHGAYGNESGFKKWMTILRIKLCSGAFLYGNYAKEILIKYGADKNKLHVIYNSLAYDEQILLRKELKYSDFYKSHFKNSNKNLVFIGRLTKVKKLDQVLKALKSLKDKGCMLNLTFVGDGTEKESLMALTEQLDLLDSVWFYGACYDEKQISEFLYNADVCVSPGNVGLTAMHAMAFGCPVISHNNYPLQMPEFEAIEEGITGAFFKENDVNDLGEVIYKWVTSAKDRDIVRNACYKVIDTKYNPHIQIETMKKVFLEL